MLRRLFLALAVAAALCSPTPVLPEHFTAPAMRRREQEISGALIPFYAIQFGATGSGGGFVGPSTLVPGTTNNRTITLVRPKDGVTITQDYVVIVGASVDLNAGGFKLGMWFHGSGENGNRNISAVLGADALPKLVLNNTINMDNWVLIVSQQASLTGSASENDPSYNQNNDFRYQCFELAYFATIADCNYNPAEQHAFAFSGGGNIGWLMRHLFPGRLKSLTLIETNAEARRISLPVGDPTYGAGNAAACGLMAADTPYTLIYLIYNNDGSFQTLSNGLGAMGAAFGDTTWLTPNNTDTIPPFTGDRYDVVTGKIRDIYVDARSHTARGHECIIALQESQWQISFMGGL